MLANLNVLLNDFVAERLHNISLTNQLETLQDEISSRERSRTPSLHEEGFRTTFNGLPDEEIMSDVMSEPFDDEKDDSSADNDDENGQISKTREVGIPNHREFSIRRHSSSFLSTFLLFFLYLFIFLAIWINLYGALVPSWVYIQVHHDHLPPQ
uniref:Uncharacterized protein n=1 Tax=Panagrolaimus superbus TaxID=310955 RepID=A0A914Y2E9_9BILA